MGANSPREAENRRQDAVCWETQGHPMRYYAAWELRQESGLVREGPLGFFSLLAAPQGLAVAPGWAEVESLWVSRDRPPLPSFRLPSQPGLLSHFC